MPARLLITTLSLFAVLTLGSGCLVEIVERAPCTFDQDCALDAFCDADDFCTDFCDFNSDCGFGEACDTLTGLCVAAGCSSNLDCPPGSECNVLGECILSACTSDLDCPPGSECNVLTGECITSICSSDLDCGLGEFCGSDGACYLYAQWQDLCFADGDCPGEGACSKGVCSLQYTCSSDLECVDIADYCNVYGWCDLQ